MMLASAFASPARADIRVWEELPEGAEEGEADPIRYFDLTAFTLPGFIWRQDDPENNNPLPTDTGFWLRRTRFGFAAQAFPWLFFRFEAEATPNFALQDAYLDFRFHPAFTLRIGQYQLAFLRTFQFNAVNLAFNDRVLFVPASPDRGFLRYLSPRDIGAMATGLIGPDDGPTFQYWLGAFNGRGPNQTRNSNNSILWSLRLQMHLFGPPERVEWESDVARSEEPKLAIATAAYTNCDDRSQFNLGWTVDAEFRYRGLFASAAFVRFNNGPVGSESGFFNGLGRALGYGNPEGCVGVPTGDTMPDGSNIYTVPYHVALGASAQVQYVLPELLFPAEGMALEVLFRFDWAAPNNPDNGTFGGGDETTPGYSPPDSYANVDNPPTQLRATFGINWFPTSEQGFRFSLNYQHRREIEDVIDVDRRIVGIKNDILWLQLTLAI
jgi:hypothetical protein